MTFRKRTLLTATVGVVGMTIGALASHYITNVYAADQPPPAPPAAVGPVDSPDITLDIAHKAVEAAIRKAIELNIKQNVAVVDAGGNLKAFARMDEAWLGSIDIAQKKARTSRLFDMKTGDIGALSQPGKPLYMIELSNNGLITFPGGVPIRNGKGQVIGAIGVSGSTVDNDDACATAGAGAVMGKKK